MNKNIFLTFIFFISFAEPAWAYLDPGTGSAIISLIIGFFVAIGVLLKTFWYKIKSLFVINNKAKKDIKDKLK